jgi:hypothetical protein
MARVAAGWRRWAWLVVTMLLGLGSLAGGGILYTNSVERRGRAEDARIIREQQADLCELLAVFDDPSAPPPETDRGRAQVAAMRAYRAKRC